MVQVFIKTDYQLRKDTICPQCTHSFEYIEVNPFRNLHNQIYFKFHVMQSSVAVLYSTKMQTCCKMLSKWSSAVWIYNSFCRGYTIYNCNFLFQSVWLFVCLFMFSNIQPDLRAYAYFLLPHWSTATAVNPRLHRLKPTPRTHTQTTSIFARLHTLTQKLHHNFFAGFSKDLLFSQLNLSFLKLRNAILLNKPIFKY